VQSPIMVSENHIISHTSSLHEGLSTLLLDKGKKVIALKHKLFLKERNISKMEDDATYVPVSARVKFKLHAWKEAEASPEFATLATQTANIISTFQLQLKNQIIQNIRLEQTFLTAQLNNLFVEALAASTSLHLIALSKSSNNTHIVALAIIAQYESTLIKHCGMTAAQVTALYRTVNTVPADVLATSELARSRATIRHTLESVFTTLWDFYLNQHNENEISIYLKKKAKEVLTIQATEDAAMEADAEVPATHQQLQDLIQCEATKIANKRTQQEVTALRKVALGNNNQRGHTSTGASQQKKKTQNGKKGRRVTVANADGASTIRTNNPSNYEMHWTEKSNGRNNRNSQRQPHRRNDRQKDRPRSRSCSTRNDSGGARSGARRDNGKGRQRASSSSSRNRNADTGRRSNRSSR
jgi:hypothetical protein